MEVCVLPYLREHCNLQICSTKSEKGNWSSVTVAIHLILQSYHWDWSMTNNWNHFFFFTFLISLLSFLESKSSGAYICPIYLHLSHKVIIFPTYLHNFYLPELQELLKEVALFSQRGTIVTNAKFMKKEIRLWINVAGLGPWLCHSLQGYLKGIWMHCYWSYTALSRWLSSN